MTSKRRSGDLWHSFGYECPDTPASDRNFRIVGKQEVILPEIHFRVARAPETTVSGQASGPLLQHGDNPGMWLINTMALGGPRRLLRRRERDQGRADDHKNCHTYQFST
jgi:hypothetical protein